MANPNEIQPAIRLPYPWLVDTALTSALDVAGNGVVQDGRQLGMVLPAAASMGYVAGNALCAYGSARERELIALLHNGLGPTAMQMRQQDRIARLTTESRGDHYRPQIEEWIKRFLPEKYAGLWAKDNKYLIEECIAPYFNGCFMYADPETSSKFIRYVNIERTPYLADVDEPGATFDWRTAESTLNIAGTGTSPIYFIKLILRQPHGSIVCLEVNVSSSYVAVQRITIYDALEDAVYPGLEEHVSLVAVKHAMQRLMVRCGYVPEQPRSMELAMEDAVSVLTASYAQTPCTPVARGMDGFGSWRHYNEYTDTTDGTIYWQMHLSSDFTSHAIEVGGSSVGFPTTGKRKDGMVVVFDAHTLPAVVRLWSARRQEYLDTIASYTHNDDED